MNQSNLEAHTTCADIESDFPVVMKPRGQDPFVGLTPGTPRINLRNQNEKIRVIGEYKPRISRITRIEQCNRMTSQSVCQQ